MPPESSGNAISLDIIKTACSNCNLRELCLPLGLSDDELERLDDLVSNRRRLKRGDLLYSSGAPFDAIYAIRSGFFKTDVLIEDGREQVTGFQMAGELLGLDGISSEHHTCNAVALEDSEVCAIPFSRLESLSREIHTLQHHFHKVMSREIVRDHGVMMLLGSALLMAWQSGQYPFVQGWLTAKFFGLLAYILLGTMALKRGETRNQRAVFLILALAAYAYIVGVALTRNPLPL